MAEATETPTEPTTEPATPATPAAPEGTPAPTTTPATEDKAPKWEGEFDPERAARLVANLREELATAKAALGEKVDAEKSEQQRLEERAANAERELAEARTELLRTKVAKEHSIPDELAAFLTGSTEEEMKAKAESLAAYIQATPGTPPVPSKPTPALTPTPGHGGEAEVAFDPDAVARAARSY